MLSYQICCALHLLKFDCPSISFFSVSISSFRSSIISSNVSILLLGFFVDSLPLFDLTFKVVILYSEKLILLPESIEFG